MNLTELSHYVKFKYEKGGVEMGLNICIIVASIIIYAGLDNLAKSIDKKK
jgi:hypothetical protein